MKHIVSMSWIEKHLNIENGVEKELNRLFGMGNWKVLDTSSRRGTMGVHPFGEPTPCTHSNTGLVL